ncbi:hypothetical protein MD484_g6368, partial [Candolleomyces efflorescens]
MKLTLACYFPAETPSFIVVEIDPNDYYVQELRKALYEKLKMEGQDVQLRDLDLYRAEIPAEPEANLRERALQWLREQPLRARLPHPETLDRVFPAAPSDDSIHILIANPSTVDLYDTLNDPYAPYVRKVQKALGKVMDDLSTAPSPSEVVKNTQGVATFLNPDDGLVYVDRVPVAMFSPPLAKLQGLFDDLESKVEPSDTEVACAAEFLGEAIGFFYDEEERQDAIRQYVNILAGESGRWGVRLKSVGDIKPTASWWHAFRFPILLLELKNTVGVGGDAMLRAIVPRSQTLLLDFSADAVSKFKDLRGTCNFPVVLIGFTGNRIQVSAAVCAGAIYVSSWCTLDLSSGFHSSQNAVRLARVFKALSSCRPELQSYYDEVLPSPDISRSLKLSALYPNPTFISDDVKPPSLVYRQFMTRNGKPTSDIPRLGNSITAMYIATLGDTDQEVIVKFTARYNKEAHSLLANAGFAPKLHFCERIVGNLHMVVMDRVEGKTIFQLHVEQKGIPTGVARQVEEALSIIHEAGIVFGDLRETNIIYTRADGSAGGGVSLVDFDWADKDGEGRYPATLNMEGLWENSVSPYGIMRKAHDLWHLQRIKRLCA